MHNKKILAGRGGGRGDDNIWMQVDGGKSDKSQKNLK